MRKYLPPFPSSPAASSPTPPDPNTNTPPSRHASTGVRTLQVTCDLRAICSACKHERRHQSGSAGSCRGRRWPSCSHNKGSRDDWRLWGSFFFSPWILVEHEAHCGLHRESPGFRPRLQPPAGDKIKCWILASLKIWSCVSTQGLHPFKCSFEGLSQVTRGPRTLQMRTPFGRFDVCIMSDTLHTSVSQTCRTLLTKHLLATQQLNVNEFYVVLDYFFYYFIIQHRMW